MDIERIKKVKEQYEEELFKKANVKSVAVGYIWRGGKMSDDVGIIVNVKNKFGVQSLDDKDMIPTEIEGVKVDVLETGEIREEGYTGYVRPLETGYSVGNEFNTAGTMGYFAKRDGKVGLTSNAHVLCLNPDEDMTDQQSWTILQPGPVDGGTEQVATLSTFKKVLKKGDGYNEIDSAWGALKPGIEYKTYIPEIGEPEGIDYNEPVLGERLRKSGRTTGYTTGKVIQVNATVDVSYNSFTGQFRDCVFCENMSAGGDSGSVMVTDLNLIKYRLFAGSPSITVAFLVAKEVSDLRLEPIFNTAPEEGIRVDFIMEPEGVVDKKRVYGNVRAQNGDLMEDVELTLSIDSTELQSVSSDGNGNFSFGEIEFGSYTVTAKKEGYKTISKEVKVE